ncbi:MAG: hypothetical protein JW733_08275 [Coriobacteriia bacterium]|nr:hypothetical protein [Coriobacteriia bacterium]
MSGLDAYGIGVALVGALVAWLPSAWVLGRRLQWTVPAIFAGAFSLAAVATGVGGTVAHLLGATLDVALGIVLALVLGSFVIGWRYRSERGVRSGVQGVVTGLLVGGLAFFQRPWFAFTSDTFYHLAAARSLLATNSPLVTDPFYRSGTTSLDPTSGIFHTWLAMVSSMSGIEVEYVYAGFAALAAAAVAWAFWALAERVSGSSWVATVCTVGFAAFGLWGDFRMAGLPNRFTVAYLCLALFTIIESTAARPERRRLATLAVLMSGAAALLAHLATAAALVIYVVAALLVVVVFRHRLSETETRGPSMVAVGGVLLAALAIIGAKAATVFSVSLGDAGGGLPEAFVSIGAGMFVAQPGKYVGGGPVAFALMTAAGLWAVWQGARRRNGASIVMGAFILVPVVLLGFPPVTTLGVKLSVYMLARVTLLMRFTPFLAAAWVLGQGALAARASRDVPVSRQRVLAFAVGAAILVAHGLASWQSTQVTFIRVPDRMRFGEAYTVFESRERDIRSSWGMPALWDARAAFGDDYPIVAAAPETGYYLAGLANVAIVAAPPSHSPLAVEIVDGPARREDMERLLDPDTSTSERRAILDARDADYVALSPGVDAEVAAWEAMRAETDLFEVVVETRRFVLLRVVR